MKPVLLFLTLGLMACSGGGEPAEQESAAIPAGTCLQLAVTVDAGFAVDGNPKAADEVGPALTAALESADRTAVVDVRCGEGVTMESIRVLHDIMLARDLNRIQYYRDPDPPIPLMLPNAEMTAHLAEMPAEARCVIAIAAGGKATMAGDEFGRDQVLEKLDANPEIVFIVAATDDVKYADFARVLGEVTGAGAQRISVQLVAG